MPKESDQSQRIMHSQSEDEQKIKNENQTINGKNNFNCKNKNRFKLIKNRNKNEINKTNLFLNAELPRSRFYTPDLYIGLQIEIMSLQYIKSKLHLERVNQVTVMEDPKFYFFNFVFSL